ncbi:TonB-dependent receptor [Chryseobacterium arthrosphaerae]|uniref:TonB-dependent receptor n=1 Tax=Chryseobacterium arthrosphaerae TaxID=651561 RepID=A0A432DTF7_9FLAO|nr:TonB-dependent receptor [Chryseobacterium arthrosphaerae]
MRFLKRIIKLFRPHGARLNFNTPFQLGATSRISLIYGIDLLKDHTVQKTLKDELVTPDMNMNNLALYVQSKVNLGTDWILKGGIRYENIRFNVGDLTKNGKLTTGENNRSDALYLTWQHDITNTAIYSLSLPFHKGIQLVMWGLFYGMAYR